MVSLASDLSAAHATSLLRKRDAKTCRGDVSEKFQVRSNSSPYTFDWFVSYDEFSFHLKAKERGRNINRMVAWFFDKRRRSVTFW